MGKLRIAVLGGNGYLGNHVANYFKADKLSRITGFDITNLNDISKLIKYDVIINMAAEVDKSGENDAKIMGVNAEGTKYVANNLQQNQTLIFASTKEIYSPPEFQNSYGKSKILAEKYINEAQKKIGFKSGIFRLATIYAKPTKDNSTFVNFFVNAAKNGKPQINLMMNGNQVRDFLYVDDLSKAFDNFIKSDIQNGIWDIGGGKDNACTFLEFIKLAGKITGGSPNIKLINEPVPDNQIKHITGLEKIMKDLNWKPKVNLKSGIQKII